MVTPDGVVGEKSVRRVLVTGGAGFIGSHLVDRLLMEGVAVSVIDDFNDFYSPESKRMNVSEYMHNSDFSLTVGDIRRPEDLDRAMSGSGITHVVHLAARAGVRPSLEHPDLYMDTNIGGTLQVLEACRRHKVSTLVFGSSSSVYGMNEKIPFSESDPIRSPISPYAASKAGGELLCHSYAHLYGIRVVCLRFFTVYGPRQRPDLAIHRFARLILEGRSIPVYGDGTTERDYTYVDDIVSGIWSALHYQEENFDVFNLGNNRTVPLAYLISLLEVATGCQATIKRLPHQPGDVMRTWADLTRSQAKLRYSPSTSIEQGIERFVLWLKSISKV